MPCTPTRYEVWQENAGRAFVGYVSLRFTDRSAALLAPERFARTCAVEISGLQDVEGTVELIEWALRAARKPHFKGVLHWGQRNTCTMPEIEERMGDSLGAPGGDLGLWRKHLAELTENGRLVRFSNAFTRQTGLEVVQPLVRTMTVRRSPGSRVTVVWDCANNPPGTEVIVLYMPPGGASERFEGAPLLGRWTPEGVAAPGKHVFVVTAKLTVQDEPRLDQKLGNVFV